jgi:hypothetical protein
MSPKQREYILGPRGQEQRKAHTATMTIVFKGHKKAKADCADCRKSKCELAGGKWGFVCTLKHALSPQTCTDFDDARKPTWEGLFVA